VSALFAVDDPHELNALLRALFAAKFHAPEDGLELPGSPLLARLCERAMEAFVAAQEAGLLPGDAAQTRASHRAMTPGTEVVASVRRHLVAVAARGGNWAVVPIGACRLYPSGLPAVCSRGIAGARVGGVGTGRTMRCSLPGGKWSGRGGTRTPDFLLVREAENPEPCLDSPAIQALYHRAANLQSHTSEAKSKRHLRYYRTNCGSPHSVRAVLTPPGRAVAALRSSASSRARSPHSPSSGSPDTASEARANPRGPHLPRTTSHSRQA
jgi:hypothetical protein